MSDDGVRVDKWLWAARFFKTRRLATEAIQGGKVELNDTRAKPAKLVRPGDELRVRKDAYEFHIIVRDLSDKRGPAKVAESLYEETSESIARREETREQLKAQNAAFPLPKSRPDKHDRKQLARFKRNTE
ncbi:RNA-binding S4 domain-containing protein [Aquisalimonas sp. APHAB1-3]|uniref:RNA-binding S4 domain-containing protein n=1 Tax=Aquisalimonas sp. APHAB1-3 TaxID=3402080 RepID=UPI003AAA2F8A